MWSARARYPEAESNLAKGAKSAFDLEVVQAKTMIAARIGISRLACSVLPESMELGTFGLRIFGRAAAICVRDRWLKLDAHSGGVCSASRGRMSLGPDVSAA